MISITKDRSLFLETLIVPFVQGENLETGITALAEDLQLPKTLLLEQIKGEKKEVSLFYPIGHKSVKRVYCLGLGTKPTLKVIIEAFKRFLQIEAAKLPSNLSIDISNGNFDPEFIPVLAEGVVSGLMLGTYKKGLYQTSETKTQKWESDQLKLGFCLPGGFEEIVERATEKGKATAETQLKILRLVNAPSNKLTPIKLGQEAVLSGKEFGYKVEVHDEKAIEKLGLFALKAVGQGSETPARFIVMEYKPNAIDSIVPKVGLVGKGVTFDTGGLSIKGSSNMHYMKSDMGGAAAVLGTIELTAKLKLPVHLIAVIPTTENCVDAKALKPGDVIGSYAEKTIEIIDTDAEGRLILADGIAYLNKNYSPDVMIDVATLTGSCVQTLGYEAGGLFTNNDDLALGLTTAGDGCGERLWRLPLWDSYEGDIKSDIADVKNYSGKPIAGAISAAKFLEFFTDKHPRWAHLDIAGVAFGDAEFYTQKTATAFGVRLLTDFIAGLDK
ncbi:leucyl aminopeptidase family protein [Arenibacter algicola]|uniref:leucyl aminopeptidase family protein n=1 Tax=Arenibacter algicola TaxID=616991 RepID=UPI001C07AEDB|nr:leucyl aminopeptidase family protein [Arenibacter algicola]MBU2904988.1 leucyl aminopeptidase family protein [Arenibacter algicola]